jgi:hypothetical protein
MGVCTEKVRATEQRATGEQREVCGTPYSVDQGSGYAEVVQDCTMENIYESVAIYGDSCEYTLDAWQEVDELSLSGDGFDPQWPAVGPLSRNQREGEREETYRVIFNTEEGQYTYSPDSEGEFDRYKIGSRWILEVNTFGAVTDTEAVQ